MSTDDTKMALCDPIEGNRFPSIVHVYDMVFEPDLPMCGNCNRTIPEGEAFRTIAPSKTRFHVGCVSKKAVGSNSLQAAYDTGNTIRVSGSVIIDPNGKGYKWP